jgi:hypothetical protein
MTKTRVNDTKRKRLDQHYGRPGAENFMNTTMMERRQKITKTTEKKGVIGRKD